jgi:hypothetical protein
VPQSTAWPCLWRSWCTGVTAQPCSAAAIGKDAADQEATASFQSSASACRRSRPLEHLFPQRAAFGVSRVETLEFVRNLCQTQSVGVAPAMASGMNTKWRPTCAGWP